MFRNILVAWDGSDHAKRALAEAVDIARTQDARLALLTVVTPPRVWPGPVVPPISEAELAEVYEKISADGEALVPDGIPVSIHTTTGHPGTELLKRAAAAGHDLIVMGSRGRGAIRSAILGSSSHFVLNHATVPVLVIHQDDDDPPATG